MERLLAQTGWLPSPGLLSLIGLLAFAALGGWILQRALFGDRTRGRPRCPKCWYSMHLAPSLRCPECGTVARDERALLRTRRHWWRALLGVVVIVGPAVAVAFTRYRQDVLNLILPRWWPISTQTVAGCTVRVYMDRSTGWSRPMQVRISSGGITYATIEEQVVELGATDGTRSTRIGIGEDINGDKAPDLIVTQYSGGAHCCFSYTIVTFDGPGPRVIAHIPAEDGGAAFADVDGDGVLEVRVQEQAFRYWKTSFADSPAPEVILRWNGAGYVLAPELMARPAIAEAELAGRAREIAEIAGKNGSAKPSDTLWKLSLLWRTMLELIYTGHADRADAFFDQAWPTSLAGKDLFRREFDQQLRSSRFWPGLRLIAATTHPVDGAGAANP